MRLQSILCCLAACVCILAASWTAEAAKFNRVVDIGDTAPEFELAGVDGKTHSLAEYKEAKAVAVIFICNHCPCVKAYEERMIALQKEFSEQGLQVVTINPNSGGLNSMPKMKTRAKESGFNFPYLHDPQKVAKAAFGARVTPQVFLLDAQRKIRYMGAIDDSQYPEEVKRPFLHIAVEAVLGGGEIETSETRPFGCPIVDVE